MTGLHWLQINSAGVKNVFNNKVTLQLTSSQSGSRILEKGLAPSPYTFIYFKVTISYALDMF